MHLMICHRCVLVFTEFLDFLKQIIILIWDFLLLPMLFTHFTVDQSKLTVNGSVLSDTPNVRYLVALYKCYFSYKYQLDTLCLCNYKRP